MHTEPRELSRSRGCVCIQTRPRAPILGLRVCLHPDTSACPNTRLDHTRCVDPADAHSIQLKPSMPVKSSRGVLAQRVTQCSANADRSLQHDDVATPTVVRARDLADLRVRVCKTRQGLRPQASAHRTPIDIPGNSAISGVDAVAMQEVRQVYRPRALRRTSPRERSEGL